MVFPFLLTNPPFSLCSYLLLFPCHRQTSICSLTSALPADLVSSHLLISLMPAFISPTTFFIGISIFSDSVSSQFKPTLTFPTWKKVSCLAPLVFNYHTISLSSLSLSATFNIVGHALMLLYLRSCPILASVICPPLLLLHLSNHSFDSYPSRSFLWRSQKSYLWVIPSANRI